MLRPILSRIFGLDPRSLAVLRIGLGLLVLYDLAVRVTDLTAHYTDAGVLPRAALEQFQPVSLWSLHLGSGAAWFQASLFLIAAAAAAALAVGYHARLMAFALFILMCSLHHRNPLVVNSGDVLLRMLLLWASLLPIGRVWSVSRRPTFAPVLSIATAGFVLQVVLLYVATGLFKFNDRWGDGGAMATVFGNALYARPLAGWLLQFPGPLGWVSRLTPWVEIGAGLLLLLPIWTTRIRVFLIVAMIAFHVGIELTTTVGLFGYVAAVAWLSLLPTTVWERLETRVHRLHIPTPQPSAIGESRAWPTQVAAGVLLILVLAGNVHALVRDRPLLPPLALSGLHAAGIYQEWKMFGRPGERSGYYLLIGRHADGSAVELLTQEPFDPMTVRRPDNISGLFPNHRWRKYYRNLAKDRWQPVRQFLARPVCDEWNAAHTDEPIVALEVNYIEEMPGVSPKRLIFYRGVCPNPDDIVFARESDAGF